MWICLLSYHQHEDYFEIIKILKSKPVFGFLKSVCVFWKPNVCFTASSTCWLFWNKQKKLNQNPYLGFEIRMCVLKTKCVFYSTAVSSTCWLFWNNQNNKIKSRIWVLKSACVFWKPNLAFKIRISENHIWFSLLKYGFWNVYFKNRIWVLKTKCVFWKPNMVLINIWKNTEFAEKYRIWNVWSKTKCVFWKLNVCFESQIWFLKTKYGNLRNTVFILKFDKTACVFWKPNVCSENQIWFSKPALKNRR